MGPCIVSIFQYISNKVQRYTVYLYLETALHVSGGTSTQHQERIQLYLQHLVFVTPYCWIYIYISKLLYMFQVVSPPIIRSTYNCIYSIWYLSHRIVGYILISGNCSTCFRWYLHPSSGAHSTVSTASGICHTVTATCRYRGRVGKIPDAVDTVVCAPDDGGGKKGKAIPLQA